MPLKIETRCQACGCKQTWIYREERGLMQSHRGCRGGSCVCIQEVNVGEVDEDEASRIETELVEQYNVADKRPDKDS
ncbi:hypothetical protein ACFQJ5_12580 [Halomicroarcula sp. GCM10025324]|uniref:hypothetical protein n=1 Tax=Haloarcula TaxID=2237 RepID=UPI0023E89D22|nr:hypothetical protein [Halomicroarcula sp. ZS-22-S1]